MIISSHTCERPLIVRCGAFGDMVLITALIRGLRARYHSDVDIVTSGAWSAPLLSGQPGVAEVMSVRSRKTPYWLSLDQRRVVRKLRLRGVGPTWFCDSDGAARPLLERAGIGDEFIVDVRDHPLLPNEHATEQWARLARIDPASCASRMCNAPRGAGGGCQLQVSSQQDGDLDAWLAAHSLSGRFVAMQIGNKRTMRRGLRRRFAVNHKYWPRERWAEVIRHVHAQAVAQRIVLLGTGAEYRLNEEVADLADVPGIYNAAEDLPMPRLIALLSRAAGLVTVDSGPAHAAAAVGCPQVVLFGKAQPSLYRPWGMQAADVRVLTGVIGGQPSMLGISAGEVIAAWNSLSLRPA